jgi:malate dehydrogenase (oxaloacetate-decarboxylating)
MSDAIEMHRRYKGKIEIRPKVPIKNLKDFSIWYTPGVAKVVKAIKLGIDVREVTWKWNTVAVVTDGTRVLGLGDVGAAASLPVMEGKSLLFKHLGGVDALPLAINEKDPDRFVDIVKSIAPSFGGINLEDIASPKCFYILERLRNELDIPVWHDDQQGTALVVLAALRNALKLAGKRLRDIKVAIIGAGAAGTSIAKYLMSAGVKGGNIVMVDVNGIIHRERPDVASKDPKYQWIRELAELTNEEGRVGGVREAMEGVDVVIGVSAPKPGIIRKEWIRLMNDDPIVFALANPEPEIWPEDAKEGGAKIVATGRSDYPNQVNNSLGFPAVFRGALSAWASKITDGMCLAASEALARYAEETGIHEDRILPTMEEREAYVSIALAVAEEAIKEGIAVRKASLNEIKNEIIDLIYSGSTSF